MHDDDGNNNNNNNNNNMKPVGEESSKNLYPSSPIVSE